MKKIILIILLINLSLSVYSQEYNRNRSKVEIDTMKKSFGQSKLPIDISTNHVVFRNIISLDSTYKSEKIYSIVKEWFSTNYKEFNRSNSDKNFSAGDILLGTQRGNSSQVDQFYKNDQPLKFQDIESKKLIGKGVLKYTGGSVGCIRVIYFEFDIKVIIKDYKLKIDITNFNYTHYNQVSIKQSQIYGFSDEGLCNSKNTIESLLKCDKCKGEFEIMYDYLTTDMQKISEDLQTYLKNNKIDDNKW